MKRLGLFLKGLLLLGSIFFSFFSGVHAQSYEIGGGLGVASYTGDIARRLDNSRLGLHGTVFGKRNFDNVWTLRLGLAYGRVSGADSLARHDAANIARNAFFRSDIFEGHAVMEYHFLDYMNPQVPVKFSPYALFGLGGFFHSTRGASSAPFREILRLKDSGSGPVQVRSTELIDGEAKEIERPRGGSLIVPLGVGVKYKLSERWIFSVEASIRLTFTDNLDGISENYDDPNTTAPVQRIGTNRFSGPTQHQLPLVPPASPGTADSPTFGPPSEVEFRHDGRYHADRDYYYFLNFNISYLITRVRCFN
ncbi:MAG: type IX secretion system protein PorG [Nitritalea sp.]